MAFTFVNHIESLIKIHLVEIRLSFWIQKSTNKTKNKRKKNESIPKFILSQSILPFLWIFQFHCFLNAVQHTQTHTKQKKTKSRYLQLGVCVFWNLGREYTHTYTYKGRINEYLIGFRFIDPITWELFWFFPWTSAAAAEAKRPLLNI